MEEDDDDDVYDEDDDFVEDEAREYGRENVGPVACLPDALRVQETFSRHATWRPKGRRYVYDMRFADSRRYQW